LHKMRVFHLNASDASHELLEEMLRGEPNIHVLGHSPSVAGGFEEMKRYFPDVVILDESACSGPAADDVQKLLTHSPYLAVLVTTSEDTSAKRRQLMNAGARDVLSKPYPAEELVESLRSVYDYIRPLRDHYAGHSTRLLIRAPKMITVFGTKGGIGKSTLSSMLAAGLSYRFREDTALVDLDLQFGDISVMMDIVPQATLTHAVENIEKLTGRELRQLMTKHPLQLYILPSPQNPEEADFISEPALIKVFSLLKEQFDYVVVDCPPGFTESSVVALERSDVILFVTSPELISLRNTKTGLKTMYDLGIDESKIKIVVNRHSSKSHFTKGMIEDILGVPVYKFLSNDYPHVLKSINQGRPEFIYDSKSSLGKDLGAMIEGLRSYYTLDAGRKPQRSWWPWSKRNS